MAVLATLAAAASGRAETADQLRREIATVGVVERLGAAVPRDAALIAEDGRPLTLAALAGRPVVLSFNYTRCPRLCSVQLAGLARALRDLGWTGDDFSVVTISVDPAEDLAQLRRYRESYVRLAGGGDRIAEAWRYAKGAPGDVRALADAVGFKYRYDARSGEFAHQATVVVLTGDGRVSGYLHGVSYAPEALRLALERASAGRVASGAEQASLGGFLLTCIGFDPADPAPRALKLMRAGGTLAFVFLASFLGVQVVRDVRRRARRPS